MANQPFSALFTKLTQASSFEEGSDALLFAILDEVRSAMKTSAWSARGTILRAIVHIRPDDGYRKLRVQESFASSRPPCGEAVYLPSTTAYRWVVERRSPVAIDVTSGTLKALAPRPSTVVSELPNGGAIESKDTRDRLAKRDATHVFVLPLCLPHGDVVGMISIEVRADAVGEDFPWDRCNDCVQILAAFAAPYLSALPSQEPHALAADPLLPIVGASTAGLIELLRVFARQEETILLAGPTGAGKSRLARFCHAHSRRRDERFDVLDLLSVPEELQMGEIFGWKRGAFTGAIKDNPGALSRAERGTLFIDEIDKLSLKAQAGLLHLLEEKVYRPIGDASAERRANVRFVVGTNADLRALCREGRFREDLYYRINVLPVKVPALDERRDELPRWADYMLKRRHAEAGGKGDARLADEAVAQLERASWPGNLRQLDNIVRRAYAFALLEEPLPHHVVIAARHVDRALAHEGHEHASPARELRRTAAWLVREAERRAGTLPVIPLGICDALKGIVLGEAVQHLGDREEAFVLLGEEGLVKSRNHHRVLRREVERAAEILRAVEPGAEAWLVDLLST